MGYLSAVPLKRDEFYTFLGGLFTSIAWILHSCSTPKRYSDITTFDILSFILLWLFFSAIIFFFGHVLSSIMPKIANCSIINKQMDPFKLINRPDEKIFRYDLQLYQELRLQLHICNTSLSSILLAYYPLYNIIDSKYYICKFAFHFLYVALIAFISYINYKTWIINGALFRINELRKGISFFDIKKYAELTAEEMIKELYQTNNHTK